MQAISYPHVEINPEGVPILTGTTTKVIEIVLDRLAHHWDADEIQRQHPHLTLAQIHSSLAYYYDHQFELDRDIERRLSAGDETLAQYGNPSLKSKLHKAKLDRTPQP